MESGLPSRWSLTAASLYSIIKMTKTDPLQKREKRVKKEGGKKKEKKRKKERKKKRKI